MKDLMYWTYVLYSSSEDLFYIGQTNNLSDRLQRHNSNRNKYTKKKDPWNLYYSKVFATRKEAAQYERKLKNFKNTEYLKSYLAGNG